MTKVVPNHKMLDLALSFPSLNAMKLDKWDPVELDDLACTGYLSSGEKHAVRFVLSVWNMYVPWKSGVFNLHEALRDWDSEHRKAFGDWAAAPSWY